MNSKEFKNYARLRNGVETVPSNIRKNYHLEKIPRGKQRGKFFFGSKIAALNFRKLFIEIEDKVIYGFDPNIIILEYKNCCYFAVSEKGDYGKKNVKESE